MHKNVCLEANKKSFIVIVFCLFSFALSAQIFGPEKIVNGDFGTISTAGKNGDNGVGVHIYPNISNLGVYYQPPTRVWSYNGWETISPNPGMTLGKPLSSSQTSYVWGLNETWSDKWMTFSSASGSQVPHGPKDGYYVIATTTSGMYGKPSLASPAWEVTLYDRYETNKANPSNYFMVVNADWDQSKCFYMQAVSVVPGQTYRMSVDLARLNRSWEITPSVAFIIETDQKKITTATPKRSIDLTQVGEWGTTFFDYTVPAGRGAETTVYVAFRNNVGGGTGNDLALDNLSMKAVIPQIKMDVNNCVAQLSLSGTIDGSFTSGYLFKWQRKQNGAYVDVANETNRTLSTTVEGTYRLLVYTSATSKYPMYSNEIKLKKDNNCVNTVKPTAVDDSYTIGVGKELIANVLLNDRPGVAGSSLTVTSFTVNGQTYSAGATAQMYHGVVSIDQNGKLIFRSISDLYAPSQLPDIYYVVSEKGGGESTATVRIFVEKAKDIAKPTGVDDSYTIGVGKQLVANVLLNDRPGVSGAALSVTSFTVNGQTYPAGTLAQIYHGAISIDQNGKLTFKSISDLYAPSQLPDIFYTLSEKDGGEATAIVRIFVEKSKVNTKPTAVNDSYTIGVGEELVGDVLLNDSPGTEGASLTVTSFTVNGQTYSAGATAQIYHGIVSVDQNGKLTFKSIPDLQAPLQMPDLFYTISEKDGGEATATVRIFVEKPKDLSITVDASCTECPVFIRLSGRDWATGVTYDLYKGDKKIGNFDNNKEIRFTETASGELTYAIVNNKKETLKGVQVNVSPSAATWKSTAKDASWGNAGNWDSTTGGGHPIWCTDVTIPTKTNMYPTLVDGDECRDITFKSGSAVGQIQRLSYRKAFVEMLPQRNRWYMLSAPLRYMYSADYHGDMTWTNAQAPKIFMMYFDVTNSKNPDGNSGYAIGDFSKPFAKLEEKMSPCKGFALWVNGNDAGYDYPDKNFPSGTPYKFPRLLANGGEPTFSYHDVKTSEWVKPTEALLRGEVNSIPDDKAWETDHGKLTAAQKDNRFRFVYEESYSNGVVSVGLKSGSTSIVGNPFMSYVDFDKLAEDNADKIYNYYRIWDGEKFFTYIAGTNKGSMTWSGLEGLSTNTSEYAATREIAPMQSFFVEAKSGATALSFKPANVSVASTGSSSFLRSDAVSDKKVDVLRLELSFAGKKSQAILLARKGASIEFKRGEDIAKLFAPGGAVPEVYTIGRNGESVEINTVESDAKLLEIPVGVRTTKIGKGELTISGLDSFEAYGSVILLDKVAGKEYDLRKVSSVPFDKAESANIENRFVLQLKAGPVSGVEDLAEESNDLSYINDGQTLTVNSSLSLLRSISVYDIMGRLVFSKDKIGDNTFSINIGTYTPGLYLLKIKTADSAKTLKVTI